MQIIENKNTLGELDFIVEDLKAQEVFHLELVYKFYLYDTNFNNEFKRYIGPNRDDTFLKKTTKLQEKQFPLLYKNRSLEVLNKIEDIKILKQETIFLAHIFLPYKQECKLELNPLCIKGFYININSFKQENEFKSYSYFLPHRFEWLCDENSNTRWNSYEESLKEIEYFLSLKKSPLVWLNKGEKKQALFITWW